MTHAICSTQRDTDKEGERHRQTSCMWENSKHYHLKGTNKSMHHREKGSGNLSGKKYLHVNYQVVTHSKKKVVSRKMTEAHTKEIR